MAVYGNPVFTHQRTESFRNNHYTGITAGIFSKYFPGCVALMPDLEAISLAIRQAHYDREMFPWTVGNGMLIGDAAHAVVPFYSQGMNCGV